jgi:UDP-2-acetamido-3-amino-2,3-dideoxy-glucuronate N-acetyltransferase
MTEIRLLPSSMSTRDTGTLPGGPRATTIDPRAVVSPEASIGDGCAVASGAVVGAGVVLEADVVVANNAVFVEPASPADGAPSRVQHGVRIGANAVIYPGITLAAGSLVRPGAVVTRSVPPRAIVEGNPATIVGYVGTEESGTSTASAFAPQRGSVAQTTLVRGVSLHTFPVVPDLRGNLTVGEFAKEIPFTPRRYFMVFGVPSRDVRGEHAHHECHQFLICVRGSCAVVADDGLRRTEVTLDAPNRGLYLPPMTWGVQYKYSADALLLVFASHPYDAADYIRDYASFLALAAETKL